VRLKYAPTKRITRSDGQYPCQGCQILFGTTNQNGKKYPKMDKKYQMALKCAKMTLKLANGHEIHKNVNPQAFENTPKGTFLVKK
jgi:hypothetical protein